MANQDNNIVAVMETRMYFRYRACAGNDVCFGSKYRFCVPQNRRTCRRAAGHGSGEEVA